MLPSLIGIIASSGGAVGSDFESIATVTVGSGGSSSITFSSIPSTYQHLQVRFMCRSTTSASGDAWGSIAINSNTTNSNYAHHHFLGNGSTVSAQAFDSSSAFSRYAFLYPHTQTNNPWAVGVMDILDYDDTNKNRTVRLLQGWDSNGSGIVALHSQLYMSTTAVTAIELVATGGNFAQYSSFALYGIKG